MDIDGLLAEREIERMLVSFARAMDERDWVKIENICAKDIRADFGAGEIAGAEAVVKYIRSFLDSCGTTQHLLGNIVINIDGDQATSESYVSDMHLSRNEDSDISFRTLGNYSDTWKKIDGAWKLHERIKNNRAIVGSMDVFKP